MKIINSLTALSGEITKENLQKLSDEAEQYELGCLKIWYYENPDGSGPLRNTHPGIYDVFWLRDHYLDHETPDNIEPMKQIALIQLLDMSTQAEFDDLLKNG